MIELRALQGQVRHLVDDLRSQVAANSSLRLTLRREYDGAADGARVGGTFESWLEDVLDQAAVAWVLGCVFVRFCEDNSLVTPRWLGGDDPAAPADRAVRERQSYLVANPRRNDRDWIREAFGYLRGLRATDRIFDKHNPVWRFDISGDAAEALSDFFRRGAGRASLRSEKLDTRFLGDLYQDLSIHARSTYALLQTPEFVERFILDRAFEPALDEFGLAHMSVIDPACGSGHFLLGAFRRLFRRWRDREPASDVRELAQRALDQVTGVDLNVAAVAIARFRLLIATLQVCGLSSLEEAPHFTVRVAAGDSLLRWGEQSSHQGDLLAAATGGSEFPFFSEDAAQLADYLKPGSYTVVVGNPPYITVKDKALNERYRKEYEDVCSGKYALSVPFAQRFFELARSGDHDGDGAGWVGQITSNSFMKREFGRKLIENYLAGQVDLREVVDTSGAFIPGHGTPTVILVGRNRLVSERYSGAVRAVLGVRGEPGQPEDPAKGKVWSAILDQIDRPGSESPWLTVVNRPRIDFTRHPWSLSGGSASDVMGQLGGAEHTLAERLDGAIGFASFPGQDEVFLAPESSFVRDGIDAGIRRRVVLGDMVRDWQTAEAGHALVPYAELREALPFDRDAPWGRRLWPMRRTLESTTGFGGQTRRDRHEPWWTWYRWVPQRYQTPLSLTFAFVATHNHFVLDRGGKVFKQSAPVIKLPASASEEDHLRLLGVLNSSTACFWLKQVSQSKGGSGLGRGVQDEAWEDRYEFAGTKVEQFPLPSAYPLEVSRTLDGLAQRLAAVSPAAVAGSGVPTKARLKEARQEWHGIRAQMIAWQEELDWQVYRLYGLLDDDLSTVEPPSLELGQRAFEIVLARQKSDTQWFVRHHSTPITELPQGWPADYRALVEKRLAAIASDRHINLIERPEFKRRWATPGWDALEKRALRDWLLDRLERPDLWGTQPTPLSVAQIADRVRHDEDFREVLDLWVGHDQHDLVSTVHSLVTDEHVPYLASQRYKPSGLRKRALWERTWAQQRREDSGEAITPDVPPKYTSADFIKNGFWRNRGKLDVPKERFISYPDASRETDPTLLLGWAGWDHLAQAQALVTVYLDRKTRGGWPPPRLLPLLAGVVELEPWLHQWHDAPQPGYPGTPAAFISGLIDTELAALGADRLTLARLRGVEVPADA